MTDALARPKPRIDDPKELNRLVKQIVEKVDPVAIYLFGSRARGDADEDSDYDLMVVISDERHDDRPKLKGLTESFDIDTDLKTRPHDRFAARMGEVGTLEHEVEADGIRLFSKSSFGRVGLLPLGPSFNWEVVQEWLDYCDHELAAAECCADEVPEQAAIHAEWATRGLVRAALVAHWIRPLFRGRIAQSAQLLPAAFPLREPLLALDDLSGHEAAFRYPIEDESLALPEPSAAQVETWIAEVEALKADFERWLAAREATR